MNCGHQDGIKHDCEYVNARNKWIQLAEDWADFVCPPVPKQSGEEIQYTRDVRWDVAYLNAMEFLTKHGAQYGDGLMPENIRDRLLPGFPRGYAAA